MIRSYLTGPRLGAYRDFQRFAIQRFERAALIATDRAATLAKGSLRAEFSAAGLGRLGYAVGSGSDLRKSGRVRRIGANGFAASGWLFVRSRSERTEGALDAYTEGADIRPVKGKYLWIATDAIPSRVGRYKMTPERYAASGLVQRIGPLVMINGRHAGEKLLVVRHVTTRLAGSPRARRMPKNGRPRPGREAQEQVVAFVGIRRTSRGARVNVRRIITGVLQQFPRLYTQALGTP